MLIPESSRFSLTPDLAVCGVLNGVWQMSGAQGRIDPERAVSEMPK